MAPKRRGRGNTAAAKRARVTSQVDKDVLIVADYLRKCEDMLEGPPSYLEMLLAAMPYVVGEGAASNERNKIQTNVADDIIAALDEVESNWKKQLDEAQAKVDAHKATQDEKDAAYDDAKSKSEAHRAKIAEARSAESAAEKAEKEAVDKLAQTSDEIARFDEVQKEKTQERELCASALESFDWLKENPPGSSKQSIQQQKTWKKHMDKFQSVLQKLKVDASLFDAAPTALRKTPDIRGSFDDLVVSQSELAVKKHIGKLDEQLNDPNLKENTIASEAKAQLAVAEAKAAFVECTRKREQLEGKAADLETAEVTAQNDRDLQEENAQHDIVEKTDLEECLAHAKEVMKIFVALKDREHTGPPAEPEEEEDEVEATEPVPYIPKTQRPPRSPARPVTRSLAQGFPLGAPLEDVSPIPGSNASWRELRAACRDRGISTDGSRQQLLERLQEAMDLDSES